MKGMKSDQRCWTESRALPNPPPLRKGGGTIVKAMHAVALNTGSGSASRLRGPASRGHSLHPSLFTLQPPSYFFLPGRPGLACEAANGDTGTPAFGFGCLGFFCSLLLLSCPLAMRILLINVCGRSARTSPPDRSAFFGHPNAFRAGKTLENRSVIVTAPVSRGARKHSMIWRLACTLGANAGPLSIGCLRCTVTNHRTDSGASLIIGAAGAIVSGRCAC
jgi:hypothetical protein